jgi:hypothetical protein
MADLSYEISYGKAAVSVYRTYARGCVREVL